MTPSGPGSRRRPRNGIPALLVCCLATLPGTAFGALDPASVFPLRLEALDGREAVVAPGAPVLHVVFFATWCPACVDELRPLSDLESRWVDRGYRVLLVAVRTRQTRERLASFARETGTPGELLFDRSGAAEKACMVERLPLHLLFDAKGNRIFRSESLAEGVGAAVNEALGKGRKQGGRP